MPTDERNVQLGVTVDSSGAKQGFEQVKAVARDMAQAVSQAGQQAGRGIDGIGAGGDGAAQRVDRATKSIIASIQRTTAAMEAGSKTSSDYFRAIASQRGADVGALKPYLDQLDAVNGRLKDTGISAAQTAAALRGVPAQFTDIVTSIASGQAPLQVLIQQGGQLKDSFGGAGNAARAIGGYIVGLVNPLTLAAGAAVALAAAYNAGSKEADAYVRALVLTGNAAGTTSAAIQGMAARIDGMVGTQAKAAETLAALAGSGRVAAADLESLAVAAIRMERDVGVAVEETVKQFAELGKAPVEASLKLNEQYNYLTAAIYEQIKALRDQGRETESASLAQRAFADTLSERATQINANLGSFERGWKAIKDAIKEAADEMLRIGRAPTINTALSDAEKRLDELRGPNPFQNAPLSEALRAAAGGDAFLKARIAEQEQLVQALRNSVKLADDVARATARSNEVQAAGIAAAKTLAEAQAKGLSKQEQMNAALAKYRDQLNALRAANPGSDLLRPEAIAAGERAIREQYKETAKALDNAGQAELANLRARVVTEQAYLEQLQQRGLAADKLNDGERLVLQIQQQLAGTLDATTRKTKEAQLAAAEELAVILRSQDAIKDRAKLEKELADQQAKQLDAAWESAEAIDAQALAQEQANATFGLGKSALAELTLAQLENTKASLEQTDNVIPGYIEALDKQIAAQKRLIASLKEGENLVAGKKAAEEAAKAAEKAQQDWQRAAEKINDSITDALMRAFESGKSFAEALRDTVVNMFKTMVLRPIIQAVVAPVAGTFGFGGAANASTGGSNILSTASNLQTLYKAGTEGLTAMFATGPGSLMGNVGLAINNFGNQIGSQMVSEFGAGMYAGATEAGGAMGAGGMAGVAGAYALGALAGVGVGRMVSGGYAVSGSGNGLVNAGVVIGAVLGGPIGAAIGGAIAGGINRLFGRKLDDVGITGTVSMTGFVGRQYKEYDGGTFRSDKTTYSRLPSDVDQALDQTIKSVYASATAYATALGLPADAALAFSKRLRLSFDGLSPEQIQAKIGKAMDTLGEDLAKRLIGTVETVAVGRVFFGRQRTREVYTPSEFAREGETALQTLQRLASSLMSVNAVMDTLNQTLLQSSLRGADAASKLIDLFGGLDQFTSATSAYYAAYYSDAERVAETTQQLTTAMAALGVAMPQSREAFRALVEAQDLMSDSGRQLYATLIGLAPAFNTVFSAAEAAAQAASAAAAQAQAAAEAERQRIAQERFSLEMRLLQLQGDTNALRQRELQQLDSSNRALLRQIYALEDQQAAAAAAQAAAEKAAQEAQAAADQMRSIWQGLTDQLVDEIRRIRGEMSTVGPASLAIAQAQFATATAQARAGDQDAAGRLPELSRTLLQLAQAGATTAEDYARLQALTANSLQRTVEIVSGTQGTTVPTDVFVPQTQITVQTDTAALEIELQSLRDELRAGQATVAANTAKVARLLDQWDGDGLPATREAA